jgi:hypothetical protein
MNIKSSIPFLLGIYLFVTGFWAIYLFFDVWLGNYEIISCLHPKSISNSRITTISTLLLTISGSILGAVIRSFRGLHVYGAIRGEFKISYSGSYLIGPWAAALLGFALYGLIRGGLFVFGGLGSLENPGVATEFGYFGIGFLLGFAWDTTLEKLTSLSSELIKGHPDNTDQNK